MTPEFSHLINTSAFGALMALVVTVFSIKLLTPLSIRIGLVDRPGGRKHHDGAIPLIGGMAMFIGFSFALLTLEISLSPYRSFLAGSFILVCVGLLDDFHEFSARSRLVAQVVAALCMTIWGKNVIVNFGDLFYLGNIHLSVLAIPVTVFAVVGVINAVNMTDGVDGLGGGLAWIHILLLILVAIHGGDIRVLLILMIISCSLLGFLFFNFPFPGRNAAKIFMGDSGSMFIGFLLAWFFVYLSQGEHPAVRPVTMIWIFALPLFDTTRLLIKRSWEGRSPFSPGRDHFHHFLQLRGMNSRQIVLTISGLALVLGLVGIGGDVFQIQEGTMFLSLVVLFVIYAALTTLGWRNIPNSKTGTSQ